MPTNQWAVDTSNMDMVTVVRVEDSEPVFVMAESLWTREQQEDIAQQIVDDWNFSCEELRDHGPDDTPGISSGPADGPR